MIHNEPIAKSTIFGYTSHVSAFWKGLPLISSTELNLFLLANRFSFRNFNAPHRPNQPELWIVVTAAMASIIGSRSSKQGEAIDDEWNRRLHYEEASIRARMAKFSLEPTEILLIWKLDFIYPTEPVFMKHKERFFSV